MQVHVCKYMQVYKKRLFAPVADGPPAEAPWQHTNCAGQKPAEHRQFKMLFSH